MPVGAPELNFAGFAPDGHLWVGLRYVDKDGDVRDFGADEIAFDSGKVVAHKELPTDVVAMYWKSANEAWFATRGGAARLLDGKLRVFTENDGMESELTRDIGPGPDGQIFVATKQRHRPLRRHALDLRAPRRLLSAGQRAGARRARQRLHRHRQGPVVRGRVPARGHRPRARPRSTTRSTISPSTGATAFGC